MGVPRTVLLTGLLAAGGCCLTVSSAGSSGNQSSAAGASSSVGTSQISGTSGGLLAKSGTTSASSSGTSTGGTTGSSSGGPSSSSGSTTGGSTTGAPGACGLSSDFTDARGYLPFSGYHALTSADLNGDGLLDLLAYGGSAGFLDVYFGEPDGGLSVAAAYPQTWSLAVGDLNGDGYPDVVAYGAGVDIYLNDGGGRLFLAGTIAPRHELAQSAGNSIAIGDLNGDGLPDLVLGEEWWTSSNPEVVGAEVAFGTGSGAFSTPVSFPGITYPLLIGDLNQDGLADIVAATTDGGYAGGQLAVLLNQGDGGFRMSVYPPSPLQLAFLTNLTGPPDLVASTLVFGMLVFKNQGDGTFAAEQTDVSGSVFTIGDFNGDCVPDIATSADGCAAGASIFFGDGDGGFGPAVGLATLSPAEALSTLGPVGSPRALVTSKYRCPGDLGNAGLVVYGNASQE